MKSRILILILLTLVLAVLLSACNPSVGEAKQKFCDSLNTLSTAVEQLNAVDANTSIEDAKQAKKDVAKVWDDFTKVAEQLKDVQTDASKGAYDAMVKELENSITEDTTLGDSAEAVGAGAKQLLTELKAINTTVCGVK
jgi:cytochrome c556